jgi:hypothetical protein
VVLSESWMAPAAYSNGKPLMGRYPGGTCRIAGSRSSAGLLFLVHRDGRRRADRVCP